MVSAVSHPVFARTFPAMSRAMEAGGIAEHRKELLADLAGEVIDVGAGTGASFGHYPAPVTRVLAVEPEPRLRAVAEAAAQAVRFAHEGNVQTICVHGDMPGAVEILKACREALA